MIPRLYAVQVTLPYDVAVFTVSADFLLDPSARPMLTVKAVDQMVHRAAAKGYPYDTSQRWGFLRNYTVLDGSTEERSLHPDYFSPRKGRNEHTAYLDTIFIPSPGPIQCMKPGCREWAKSHYRVDAVLRHGISVMGREWAPGDEVDLCPPHAYEFIRESADHVIFPQFKKGE